MCLYHFLLHTASASGIVGFPSLSEITAPNMSTQVLPFINARQWVFPSMVFNCTGNITRWIFRAEETGNNNERVPRMSTWRDHVSTPSVTTDFTQISQSGSAEELTGNGPVYEYVLQEPVAVQEGDILGFDLSPGDEELQFVFLDLGVGNVPDSYRRNFANSNIDIQRVLRNQRYLPLITAVIGEFTHVASDRQSDLCSV